MIPAQEEKGIKDPTKLSAAIAPQVMTTPRLRKGFSEMMPPEWQ
jgi:hypothetical protein